MIGVAAAGVMLWLATTILPENVSDASLGGYWAAFGLVAIGGLVMALSQLLGGWTKWGWPRVSGHVFLVGFLPTLVVGGWMLAAHEPANYWLGRHVRSWSGDIGIDGLVDVARAHDPGDRVRDRARLRAHVRHDRPADPAQDEAGPGRRCAAASASGRRRQRTRWRRTGEFASVTRTHPRRSPHGSRPSP